MLINLIRKTKLVFSSSRTARKIIEEVVSSRLYFELMKMKIKRKIKESSRGPFNLVIETSNFCNARCLMCPHQKMKRPKKVMKKEVFEAIIQKIKEEKLPINKVFFSGMGEPLTDPDLIFRVKEIKKLGFWVRLYTNASLLSPERTRQLIELGLDEINISFNGASREEYQRIMGLDFEKTRKNIEWLLKIRKEKLSRKPFVQISLVVIRENEREIKKHIQYWKSRVDSVTVSLAHEWGGGVKINSKFKIPKAKSERVYPCRSLWHTFVIDSSGNFVICCRDYESRYVLGNIRTHSFADVYKNSILENFRRSHLEYSPKKLPPLCQKCNFPYQGGVEWFLPRSLD